MNRSKTRMALTTGGLRGIGLEVAKKLASKECRFIMVARDLARLHAKKAKIDSLGRISDIFTADFLRNEAVERLQDFPISMKLRPTFLVDALGGGFGSLHFDHLSDFEEVMRLHFFVAHELTKLSIELREWVESTL